MADAAETSDVVTAAADADTDVAAADSTEPVGADASDAFDLVDSMTAVEAFANLHEQLMGQQATLRAPDKKKLKEVLPLSVSDIEAELK